MKWSESIHPKEDNGVTTPTIKNHSVRLLFLEQFLCVSYVLSCIVRANPRTNICESLLIRSCSYYIKQVTYHDSHLYCFGGYDGRRNHQTLLIYSLKEKRWLLGQNSGDRAEYSVRGAPPPGRNGHTATLALRGRQRRNTDDAASDIAMNGSLIADTIARVEDSIDEDLIAEMRGVNIMNTDQELVRNDSEIPSLDSNEHNIFNTEGHSKLLEQDSYEGNDTSPKLPPHQNPNETLLDQSNQNENNQLFLSEDEDAQIIIIGGWLGSGPLAASDTWILDISSGLSNLRWFQPPLRGTPPGPCNMHSADYIPPRGEVYVFRGGNGREYLNDLHALNVSTYVWRRVQATGEPPQRRANHSSAVLEYNDKCELFIFGGWNGSERLNDIHILDTETSTWSEPRVGGIKPHPRAGMTLTALRGRLYLFGGSGTSSKCFDDLQIFDRKDMTWLDVNDEKDEFVAGGGRNIMVSNGNSRENDSLDWYTWGEDGVGNTLGGQDGMSNNDDKIRQEHSSNMKFADWRSQESHHNDQHGFALADGCVSANPNDEDMVHSVFVVGRPPGKRAGHTSTAVGRFIHVFGGSCGTDYLSDFFVLDTDPPPAVKITEPASPQLYARRLARFYNDEEFADVIFNVEGQRVFGHKLVLSTVSDCFRAMFMTGFRESGTGCTEIDIPNTNYDTFLIMMEYIYTGKAPKIDVTESDMGMDRAIALLELSDQFFLYNLKQICEEILQPVVNADTYLFLMSVAQKTNSAQLELYCRYFERNMNEIFE